MYTCIIVLKQYAKQAFNLATTSRSLIDEHLDNNKIKVLNVSVLALFLVVIVT